MTCILYIVCVCVCVNIKTYMLPIDTAAKEIQKVLRKSTVTEEWTGAKTSGHYVPVGLFSKGQVVTLDVSQVGCGVHSGRGFTVVQKQGSQNLVLEAFMTGEASLHEDRQ